MQQTQDGQPSLATDLRRLFQDTPGVVLAGEALDDLVSNTEAAVIKGIGRLGLLGQSDTPELEERITDIYNDEMGAHIHNAIWQFVPGMNKNYNACIRLSRAAIRAILLQLGQ